MKDFSHVNGVKVEARNHARYTEETRPNQLVKVGTELTVVDELLLADGTVTFQCMHPLDEDCTFVSPNIRSVTAHQSAHTKRSARTARETAAELARTKAELDARQRRKSEGGVKAAKTRAERQQLANGAKTNGTHSTPEVEQLRMRVVITHDAVQAALDEHQAAVVAFVKASGAAVPPDVIEKAAKWDALMANLKS